MYRVLAAASMAASFGLAIAVAPSALAGGGHFAPKVTPRGPVVQPVIGNPGIGTLRRPQSVQHFRNHGGHHHNFGNFGPGSGFVCFDGLNCTGAGSNTNSIVNNVFVEPAGSGVQEVAGIREAPPQRPAIYVIGESGEGGRTGTQRQSRARVLERGPAGWADLDETPAEDGYGPRIIKVPAR